MQMTDQDVMRIAELARLRFSPEERARLTGDLNRIFRYFQFLEEADTSGVEPLVHARLPGDVQRSDDVQPCLPLEDVVRNAPETEKSLFKVPHAIER